MWSFRFFFFYICESSLSIKEICLLPYFEDFSFQLSIFLWIFLIILVFPWKNFKCFIVLFISLLPLGLKGFEFQLEWTSTFQDCFFKNSLMFSSAAFAVTLFRPSGLYSGVRNKMLIYFYFSSQWLVNYFRTIYWIFYVS